MKTIRVSIDVHKPLPDSLGLVSKRLLDATTEEDIAKHKAIDDAAAMLDAAQFARRVRRRLGFSQAEFAMRIDVSLDTIRNWEQGKRSPTGAAKALLKVLDKAPEVALADSKPSLTTFVEALRSIFSQAFHNETVKLADCS